MERICLKEFPPDILRDIEAAESILIRHGAMKIILYGSMARGDYKTESDIDICFEGIPDEKYFRTVAECLMAVHRRINILDFKDVQGHLRERILMEGRVIYEQK